MKNNDLKKDKTSHLAFAFYSFSSKKNPRVHYIAHIIIIPNISISGI